MTPGVRRLAVAPEPDRDGAETARATPDADRSALRATASQLSDQGLSNREIGRQLGISKDKVKRLLDELAAEEATAETPAEPDRADTETARATGADRLVLALDDDLREHLAVLADAGYGPERAVSAALALLAQAHETARTYNFAPAGSALEIAIDPLPGADFQCAVIFRSLGERALTRAAASIRGVSTMADTGDRGAGS